MSMTPNAPVVNAPEIVTPYRKEGDRLTPILTPTDASLVSYENTSPEAEFKGTNMKEALDTLFDRIPAMPDNGQKILASSSSTSTDWTVPQGIYECLCVLISPGGSIGMYDGGYHAGGYCLSFRMPTTPGTVLRMVIQGGAVSSNSLYAGISYKDNPNKLYSYAYTPKANTPSWNNTLPGAEVIFSSRAGKSYMNGSGSSNKSRNLQGGAFRIKNSDLAHFALYGGTSAYKTPTDAIKPSSPGVSVSGPSGARTSSENGYDGFGVARYSYMTPSINAQGGLVAVLWGPQIHV